jgi:copper chaperone CopZ
MAELTLKIEGMSCQHCVQNVKKALDSTDGVTSSDVAIANAAIVIDDTRTSRDKVVAAVEKAGYKVVG